MTEREVQELAGEEVFNRRGKPMRMLLLDPQTADHLVEDLQVLSDDVAEELSDYASDGSRFEAELIPEFEQRLLRLKEVLTELQLTRVIVKPVEETPEQKRRRLENQLCEDIAARWFENLGEFDDDGVVEMMEDHMALFDMVPLVPLDHDDEQVMRQYKAYEEAERRLYRKSWLALAHKIIDEYERTGE